MITRVHTGKRPGVDDVNRGALTPTPCIQMSWFYLVFYNYLFDWNKAWVIQERQGFTVLVEDLVSHSLGSLAECHCVRCWAVEVAVCDVPQPVIPARHNQKAKFENASERWIMPAAAQDWQSDSVIMITLFAPFVQAPQYTLEAAARRHCHWRNSTV